jgi:uncharacterized Zn finger protein
MKKKSYKLRTPLTLRGGIRAQTAHAGPFRVWWSRRWTDVLEGFRMGARLGRGRHYAISGQVSDLRITPGIVSAEVQGASTEPYRCEIRFAALTESQKQKIRLGMESRPMLTARLLAGELPHEVESLFEQATAPLFPRRSNDIQSKCSCPDWANPCKHLAAVYCLLGETISRNPLLLLALRGLSRADLLGCEEPTCESARSSGSSEKAEVNELKKGAKAKAKKKSEKSCVLPEEFYGTTHTPLTDFGLLPPSGVIAPLLQRLGPLPFWRGQERFSDTLEQLYSRAIPRGMMVWSGEPLDLRRPEEKVVITGASLHLKQHLRIERG